MPVYVPPKSTPSTWRRTIATGSTPGSVTETICEYPAPSAVRWAAKRTRAKKLPGNSSLLVPDT